MIMMGTGLLSRSGDADSVDRALQMMASVAGSYRTSKEKL